MQKVKLAILLLALMMVVGCAGYRDYRQAQTAEQTQDWDRAVLKYMELIQQEPSNINYRAALLRAKIQASHQHFDQGKKLRDAGLNRQAMIELQKAVQLDPTNQYALAELGKVREAIEAERNGRTPASIDEMKEGSRGSVGQPPQLNPRSDEPIDLDFPEPVSLQKIYQALGKAFGINVLFDPKLRDQDISITLREVTAQDALEILMRTAGHFYKVVDEHSIIVVADTPQNRRNYEDLIIQTFFLSNSDVKDVMAMLRSLVDARKIASNEKLNAIILRDTADKVKVAERIIQANDKAKAEVVVNVELLLLGTQQIQDLGVSLSSYQIGLQLDTGGEDVPLRVSDLEFLNENDWTVTVPSFVFDFLKETTDAQVLAKPQLRISEGERARLRIGDRVPVPVTSFNTANTVGSNVVPITSFQYQDVGIILEVEPRVHHNNEISLQISVEISNISGRVDNQPIIGTRNIETTIRLQDGETNFLAGLLRTDETNQDRGIPGLSDIPVIGRLFSKKRTETQQTDIVMTLTPHIIRRADITEDDLVPIWVGTEANITFRGGSPRVESDEEGPFEDDEDRVQDVQDRMRQRLQQLPRGLRGETPEEGQPEPPPGIELVPTQPASTPFDRGREQRDPNPADPPPEEEDPPRLGSLGVGDVASPKIDSTPFGDPVLELPPSEAEATSSLALAPRDQPSSLTTVVAEEASVELRIVPGSVEVMPGDEFELRLEARARTAVSHLPMVITFDAGALEWAGVADGDFLGQEGERQILAELSEPGRLVIGASRLGRRPGVSGKGTVAHLRFRAIGKGESALHFDQAKALDAELARVPGVVAHDARVQVLREPVRPSPVEPPRTAVRLEDDSGGQQ